MPVALVTGATGLVGSHIIEALVARGWHARAIVRDPARAAWLGSLGAEPVEGDVLDAGRLMTAARGCDAIVHAAAVIAPRGGGPEFSRVNVDGTRRVVDAAAATGARLVHISSVAVYGAARAPVSERSDLAPLDAAAHYARSKRESEAVVLEAHAGGRAWATALRPCVVYGRRDRQFVPRVARLLALGVAPVVAGGTARLAIIHASSVADAAVRAIDRDEAGGLALNVANERPLSYLEFVRLAGRGLGCRVVTLPVPETFVRAGLGLIRASAALRRGGDLSVVSARSSYFLTTDNPYDSRLAERVLGWRPIADPLDAVPDAFAWWREHGRRS